MTSIRVIVFENLQIEYYDFTYSVKVVYKLRLQFWILHQVYSLRHVVDIAV